jgi:hypothetical protein
MAGLQVPLSTLRLAPRDALRMTRGQSGLLFLSCSGLSPSTLCRSPGALPYFISPFVKRPPVDDARQDQVQAAAGVHLLPQLAGVDPAAPPVKDVPPLFKKLPRLAHKGGGLFQTAGLLEEELLQLRRLGVIEGAEPQITGDRLLMLGDRRLPSAVEFDQPCIKPQLRRAEENKFLEELEWLLLREATQEPDEGDLVGKTKPVMGAPALAELYEIFFG